MKINKSKIKIIIPAVLLLTVIVTFSISYFMKNSNIENNNVVNGKAEKVHFLKNWTIYYNVPLDADKIKNKDITVIDEKGKKVDCEITLAPFGKAIELLPPKNGYEEGKAYTLKVGAGEDCTIEKVFNTNKSIKFQVYKEAADNTKVVFLDKNFESLVRNIINKPTGDIEVKDVKNVTSVVLTSTSIINLKGIEYFTNLHSLSLDVNRIKNIEPLKTLTDINYLGLSNNEITDISSIKNLKYLKRLFLLGNPVKDYKVLDSINENLETKDYE